MIRNLLSESLQAVICQVLINKPEKGRVAAFEVMLGTTGIRNLIREDKIAQMYSAMQTGLQSGMCTFEQAIEQLIKNDLISPSAAQDSLEKRNIFESVNNLE